MKTILLAMLVTACGSSSTGADAQGQGLALTVKNFDGWCAITVEGGSATTLATETVTVTTGTVTLTAKPASSAFELGPAPWHDTTGDSGSGDPGTVTGSGANAVSTTTVSGVTAAGKCVWACCPFTSGSGCPTTDQCM
jgi:hypothetical protein